MKEPKHIRYIKLGDGGRWAKQSIEEGMLLFGYSTIPHEVCLAKDWNKVKNLLSDRKSEGAQTAGQTEVKTFYSMGEDCLWFTFANGHLFWCFAEAEVQWIGAESGGRPSRKRDTIGGWHKADVNDKPLQIAYLSSKLTKTGNFRATICKIAESEEAYLLRRINGIEEPVVTDAKKARQTMIDVAIVMIRGLHWADFETLSDLIFARSGWQRSTRVGETLADIDFALEQPTTGEKAFVQVKSDATQAVLDDYLYRFRHSGYDRFFFVCHKDAKLKLPNERNLHLFEGERLAEAAVKNGLFDWLIERSG